MNEPRHELSQALHLIPRREFLRDSALMAGAAATGGTLVAQRGLMPISARAAQATPGATPAATPVDLATYVPVALSATELETLKAATDRIIPPDELGPSASEAGVFVYIDRTLAGYNAAALPLFQAGLAALDQAASPSFAEASPDKQDEALTTAEAGKLDGDPGGFFATLLEFTRQGMFADPIHGGNINFGGWDLIGYPGIKLVWTEGDQDIDAHPESEHISVEQFGGVAE